MAVLIIVIIWYLVYVIGRLFVVVWRGLEYIEVIIIVYICYLKVLFEKIIVFERGCFGKGVICIVDVNVIDVLVSCIVLYIVCEDIWLVIVVVIKNGNIGRFKIMFFGN